MAYSNLNKIMQNDNEQSGAQPQQVGAHIQAAIAAARSLRSDPAISKKWLNKTVARLEEAGVFSTQLYKPEVASLLNDPAAEPGCTCPPGVRAADCPVHGGNK